MKGVYDFEPKKYKNTLTGVLRISYYNVALGAYMQQKSLQLLDEIVEAPKELKREFLRAFFDDEGCMDFRPKERRRGVRGYQKNTRILKSIQTLLADFYITATLKLPNEVVVTGKNNLQKFQQEINFSPGIFINGERSNSIWKENLEKRELLIRALNSFK